ncbi:hypothetical protein ACLKA6_000168 [Drosophila palustris]
MCIDYRQLNANSIPDAYPLPRIHHILERLRNAKYISTLDLKSGYWQIPMAHGSREYTAFTVPGRGLFHWKVMLFGLHSAHATFQRALDSVIGPDMEPFAFAYLDDIIVSGATLEEHVLNLEEVLRRLRQANLRLNRAKCKFFRRSLVYLGHVISGEGIHTDPDKIAAVRQLQLPTTCRELRRCLGIASWYRRFVPNFADIVQPMSLLLKKGQKWDWKPEQQAAFEEQQHQGAERMAQEEPNCKWITRLTKRILAPDRFPDFTIEGSQVHLGHRPEEEDYVPGKLCVAFDHRPRVLAECHDHPTAGHLGIRKTIARISQRYYWPGLFRDVARYVKQCQKFKVSQLKPAGRMLTHQVEEPFGTLCADFVGPLPRSKHGNTMLLVFFDAFTKWVELIPLRKATSAHLERAFREAILSSRHRVAALRPVQPTTEPGGTRESAINTSVSDTTGFSPAFLVQGREPRLPGALYDEVTQGNGREPGAPEDKARRLQEIFRIYMANRPDESSEAEGIVLGERAGHSGQYSRRPHDADYVVHSPYNSEQCVRLYADAPAAPASRPR